MTNVLNLLIQLDENKYGATIPCKSGKFHISMIAGKHAYSNPRELVNPLDYTHVEIAIFNEKDEWASFNAVKPLFDIIGQGEYYESDDPAENDEPSAYVFGYIPVEKIWDVVNAL